MTELNASDEDRLTRLMAKCRLDPPAFMRIAYPWNMDAVSRSSGPRTWQNKVNEKIKDHLQNPVTRFTPLMIAVASGHGVGKSSEISMIIDWALSTCADCKVIVTANTDTQLRSKTWPEVSKWARMALNSHWFTITATAIAAKDPDHERTWRADAIPWSETNPEAFAGMHNKGRRILLIFDEASAISDKIWEVAEGAMTDADTEIIWLAFGNPTRNTGRFKECFGRFKHRWTTMQIDSRDVEGTNKIQIQQWIDDYGEDSDFVRVRVKGEFPRAGSMQFIPGDIVDEARRREPATTSMDPLIMGVDVARFGDDQSVIVIRRGRDAVSVPWAMMRGVDTMTLAAKVMELAQYYKPDAIFVDEGGVGGGVVDRLRMLKLNVIGIQFGAKSDRSQDTGEGQVVYANKRAEMWGYMRDWLKGGSIPNDPDLAGELTSVEYGYAVLRGQDSIQLEKKADMKKRGLASPDKADALCFVANTMIQTPNGKKPIQDLKLGDIVSTPFGDTKIMKLWENKTNELTTVNFSNGSILSGKGEHKIFVWGKGKERLDALTLTDVVSSYQQGRILWAILRKFITKANGIEFKPLVDIINRVTKTTPKGFFIAVFGLIIMVLYPKNTTFITKMKIGATTIFPIWKPCLAATTNDITQRNLLQRVFLNPLQNMLYEKLRNGTVPKKALNGIENMPNKFGKMPSQKLNNANVAIKITKPIWEIQNIVPVPARKRLVLGRILRIKEHVTGAVKNLWRIAIGQRNVVPVHVQTENVELISVYNLTLEKHNVYYANDILVYNCLTFAYPVMPSVHQPTHKNQNMHQSDYKALTRDKARGRN